MLDCLNAHVFFTGPIFCFSKVTCYSKHAINKDISHKNTSVVSTHIHREQARTYTPFVCSKNGQISKPQAFAPIILKGGIGRKWRHRHSGRSPDADKVALPGNVKRETHKRVFFSVFLSSRPIKAGVITARSYSDIRHCRGALHNNTTETRWECLGLIQEQGMLDELSMLKLLFSPCIKRKQPMTHKVNDYGLGEQMESGNWSKKWCRG